MGYQRINGTHYVDEELACVLLDVTDVTLRKWMTQADPPPFDADIGMYPLRDLGRWVWEKKPLKNGRGGGFPYVFDISKLPNKGKAPSAEPAPDTASRLESEARLAAAKADIAEMDRDGKRGTLIEADKVQSALTLMVTRVKSRLLRIPSSLAPMITGLTNPIEVQEKLNDRIREALEQLAVNGWDTDEDIDA
jgi:phage terminase Nu1 subunit (DNA packaging protein)